jgi:hypothetical protein
MNKSLGILIIAALSGLLWAGCGGSDAGSDCVAGKACVCAHRGVRDGAVSSPFFSFIPGK